MWYNLIKKTSSKNHRKESKKRNWNKRDRYRGQTNMS